jgi:DNA topoisomerase-3
MRPCKYTTLTVKFNVAGETFSVQSRKVIDPGFTAVMTWQAVSEEESFDALRKGQTLNVKEAKLAERETSPPGYLTEAELITLMEKYGIGTVSCLLSVITVNIQIGRLYSRTYQQHLPTELRSS